MRINNDELGDPHKRAVDFTNQAIEFVQGLDPESGSLPVNPSHASHFDRYAPMPDVPVVDPDLFNDLHEERNRQLQLEEDRHSELVEALKDLHAEQAALRTENQEDRESAARGARKILIVAVLTLLATLGGIVAAIFV